TQSRPSVIGGRATRTEFSVSVQLSRYWSIRRVARCRLGWSPPRRHKKPPRRAADAVTLARRIFKPILVRLSGDQPGAVRSLHTSCVTCIGLHTATLSRTVSGEATPRHPAH